MSCFASIFSDKNNNNNRTWDQSEGRQSLRLWYRDLLYLSWENVSSYDDHWECFINWFQTNTLLIYCTHMYLIYEQKHIFINKYIYITEYIVCIVFVSLLYLQLDALTSLLSLSGRVASKNRILGCEQTCSMLAFIFHFFCCVSFLLLIYYYNF